MRLVFVLEYASFAGGMMSSSKELMKLFVKNDFEVHMLAPTSLPSVSGVIRHNLGGPIVLRKRNFISSIWSYVRINYILLNFLKNSVSPIPYQTTYDTFLIVTVKLQQFDQHILV